MKNQRFKKQTGKAAHRNSNRDQRGAYLVEFAIVAPLLLLLVFGIMEFGRAVWAYSSVAHAAREGVRYAVVRGTESGRVVNESDIETYVRNKAGLGPAQVNTTWTPNKLPGSVVQVNVQYNFQPAVPMMPAMTLTSTSRMVISF